MSEDKEPTIEATNPTFGSIKIRGTDFVSIITCLFVSLIAWVLYQHTLDTGKQSRQFTMAVGKLADAQKESARQQRLLTCIVSRSEQERKSEFGDVNSFCRQVTAYP